MRILDKYIIKEFIGPFVFGICAFTSIFIGTGMLYRIAEYITQYGASLWMVTKIFILGIPNIVVLTFPMSVLLGSLLAFGRLSGTSELIVMRAGGQSFFRLAMPIFILATTIALGTTVINEFVVPHANYAYDNIIRYEIKRNATPQTQEHIVVKDVNSGPVQRLMYAKKYGAETRELSTLTLQEFTNDVLSRVQNAESAIWKDGKWIMSKGVIYDLSVGGGVERMMRFENQELPISQTPKDMEKVKKAEDQMTISELRNQIKAYKASYVNTNSLVLEMHKRFAIPMACLVFALVGAPLGLQKQRGSSSIGLGISVVVIFFYYTIMTLSAALGKSGSISPALGAWLPNIIGIMVGGILVYRASK